MKSWLITFIGLACTWRYMDIASDSRIYSVVFPFLFFIFLVTFIAKLAIKFNLGGNASGDGGSGGFGGGDSGGGGGDC
jgi:uncharacterized membrane protein YgcG